MHKLSERGNKVMTGALKKKKDYHFAEREKHIYLKM